MASSGARAFGPRPNVRRATALQALRLMLPWISPFVSLTCILVLGSVFTLVYSCYARGLSIGLLTTIAHSVLSVGFFLFYGAQGVNIGLSMIIIGVGAAVSATPSEAAPTYSAIACCLLYAVFIIWTAALALMSDSDGPNAFVLRRSVELNDVSAAQDRKSTTSNRAPLEYEHSRNADNDSPRLSVFGTGFGRGSPGSPFGSLNNSRNVLPHQKNQNYNIKIQAKYDYVPNANQLNELSCKKNEILWAVSTEGEHWWQARKEDGTTGIVPSNYMIVLPQTAQNE